MNKHLRNILCLFLCFAMLLSMAACKKNNTGNDSSDNCVDGQCDIPDYDENGNSFVWAENRGKLEKRPVTVGEYNMMNDTFEILEGLTEEDYIAFPDPEICKEGAPTTHSEMIMEEEIFEDAIIEGAMIEGGVA